MNYKLQNTNYESKCEPTTAGVGRLLSPVSIIGIKTSVLRAHCICNELEWNGRLGWDICQAL